jgi:hypothetical protein
LDSSPEKTYSEYNTGRITGLGMRIKDQMKTLPKIADVVKLIDLINHVGIDSGKVKLAGNLVLNVSCLFVDPKKYSTKEEDLHIATNPDDVKTLRNKLAEKGVVTQNHRTRFDEFNKEKNTPSGDPHATGVLNLKVQTVNGRE